MSLYDTKKKGQWDPRQQEKDRIKNHGQGNTAAVGKNTGLSFTLNARQQAEYDRIHTHYTPHRMAILLMSC